jgi:probable lipoprotein NlpC
MAKKADSTLRNQPKRFLRHLFLCCGPMTAGKACSLLLAAMILATAGCTGHRPLPPEPLPPLIPPPHLEQTLPETVHSLLEAQLAEWQGVPYRRGGLSSKGVDCSGFVYLTFRERFGLELPRTTAGLARTGVVIKPEALASGDLVFFRTSREGMHVGIYLGGNRFVHASLSRGVIGSSLTNIYWAKHFWQARRVLLPAGMVSFD